MTNAPKTVGLVHNGFGGWRLWTADDADDPTVVAVPYLLASEHERLMAERDAEIARLREVLHELPTAGRGVRIKHIKTARQDERARAAWGDDNG